ncbi:MAG: cytochrome c [Armatimonadetes bacterium]|nr:cytochrome c [Armatimonadota bacterium]
MKRFALIALALAPLAALQAAPKAAHFAPLDYFEQNCARCHGPNGSFYGAEFGKGLKDDAALRHIVKEMAEGPGNAPLSPENLEILTDFHRSLRDGTPYLVVVEAQQRKNCLVLSGEATPDSKITLGNDKESVAVKLEGHKWSVEVPRGFDVEKASLRAVKEGKEKRVAVS